MARSVDLGDNVDTTLEVQGINNAGRRPRTEKVVYLVGIRDDICDVRWSVDLFGRVSSIGSKCLVTGDDEREALTVDNMPMEGILLL